MSKFKNMSVPVDKPERMFITHPITMEPLVDAAGKAAYLDLYSADSERARSYNRKTTQKRLDMRGRAVLSAASIESDNYGLLAELTAGWSLVDLAGGAIDVPFTTQNARELYGDPGMSWLREQADAFAGSRGNFLKPSANNSAPQQNMNSQPSES
jgi:hypothetical protein